MSAFSATGAAGAAPPAAQTPIPHNLILEDRARLSATGVTRVLSCDENGASMETGRGRLTVLGRELSVSELSLETGEIRISGRIDQIEYTETLQSSGGLLRRLVR